MCSSKKKEDTKKGQGQGRDHRLIFTWYCTLFIHTSNILYVYLTPCPSTQGTRKVDSCMLHGNDCGRAPTKRLTFLLHLERARLG